MARCRSLGRVFDRRHIKPRDKVLCPGKGRAILPCVRLGDWKLVKNHREPVAIYNLGNDIGESTNLAAEQPERVAVMKAAWQRWDSGNLDPLWTDASQPPAKTGKSK